MQENIMNINLNTTIHSGTVNGVSTTNAPAKDNAPVQDTMPRQNLTVSFAKVDDSASVEEIPVFRRLLNAQNVSH